MLRVMLVFVLALGCRAVQPESRPRVVVSPGADLQALASRHPTGTIFVLQAGVYRSQSITPKDHQAFIAERDAVLNGSTLVSDFAPSGELWVAPVALTGAPPTEGVCIASRPLCRDVNDVFADDTVLSPAASLGGVDASHYFLDRAASRLYLGFDPAGHVIEIATLPSAFDGAAEEVTIRGLVIEKYANRAQTGAVMGSAGRDWLIEYNIVRNNHGVGVAGGPRCRVRDNLIAWNGQLGVTADGQDGLFEGNEIAFNNWSGYLATWEGGGGKFAETSGLTVRFNYVHDNFGFGLWTDLDSVGTTYEHNAVLDNEEAGIFHVMSAGATIRDNYVARNGRRFSDWLWGAQILLANSWDVVVTGNYVEVHSGGGNGIGVVQQDRGAGRLGPRLTRNNTVTHNEIVYAGEVGLSGIAADFDEASLLAGNNVFDFNVYRAPAGRIWWLWGEAKSWSDFRAEGQEANGAFLLFGN